MYTIEHPQLQLVAMDKAVYNCRVLYTYVQISNSLIFSEKLSYNSVKKCMHIAI